MVSAADAPDLAPQHQGPERCHFKALRSSTSTANLSSEVMAQSKEHTAAYFKLKLSAHPGHLCPVESQSSLLS